MVLFFEKILYLDDALMWEEEIIFRHSGGVIWVSCSPSGDYLASLGEDNCITIYSFRDRGVGLFMKGLGPAFTCACWSLRGLLAVGTQKSDIFIFDIERRKREIKQLLHHSARINCMSWRSVLASGGEDKAIILWDIDQRKHILALRKHKKEVLSIDWSPDGKYLVSGGRDKKVFIWKISDKKPLVELPKHTDIVMAVAFSNDGKLIASCTRDGILKIWKFGTWSLHKTVKLESTPRAISWSPDGRKIAIACGDGKIAILDIASSGLESFNAHKGCATVVAWCQHRGILLSGGSDGIVKLWKKH